MVVVRFLGSGNAFCPNGRLHSLVLIDERILVDAPPTIIPQLKRANLSPADINTLLITHWHGDHIFGFPFFILERKYISDREGKNMLNVHLHEGGASRLVDLSELAYPNTLTDVLDERITFHEEISGDVAGCPEWHYERFAVEHEPETDPHGYQLDHASGLTIIHSGDSGPCQEIEERSGNADVVIIELGVPDGVPTEMHYKPSTLTELANNNPHTIFLATHLFTNGDETISHFPDNVIQVRDGEVFTIEKDGLVTKIN
jgi:ribonuclease BN (tRNA processing enzyme)